MNEQSIRDDTLPTGEAGLVQHLLAELRVSRESAQAQHLELTQERRRERRWRALSQFVLFGLPLLTGLVYALFIAFTFGGDHGPRTDVVGVVRIDGEIGADRTASAQNVIPALQRAFESPYTKAVVLSIDSPGGAPVEAERINDALAMLRKKNPKPVVAVINTVGASAAYMIAMQADKIYAARYSLVGSIGAIVSAWDLHRALARFDVAQRIYASGPLKSMLNPFEPMSAKADAKALSLVENLGKSFVNQLVAKRGKSLKPDTDYSSGEVWGGEEAKALGLVDEVGTLDQVIDETWRVSKHDFGPGREEVSFLSKLMKSVTQSLAQAVLGEAGPQLR